MSLDELEVHLRAGIATLPDDERARLEAAFPARDELRRSLALAARQMRRYGTGRARVARISVTHWTRPGIAGSARPRRIRASVGASHSRGDPPDDADPEPSSRSPQRVDEASCSSGPGGAR